MVTRMVGGGDSMMCDQLQEHKKCAIFPEGEETQANQQERKYERASAFEYLSANATKPVTSVERTHCMNSPTGDPHGRPKMIYLHEM